jgi:hypothetical protein
MNTKALLQDLEVSSLTPKDNVALLGPNRQLLPKPGETASIFVDFAGIKIYVDAAWKQISGQGVARPGLAIYLAIPDDQGAVADVLISATSSAVASAIQTEA